MDPISLNHVVNGLSLRQQFITPEEQDLIINFLDSQTWSNEIKRRIQHYGYKFSYRQRKVDLSALVYEFPECLKFLSQRFVEAGIVPMEEEPDQIIVNEYLPGEHINQHIDSTTDWGSTIISLSLLSGCAMKFTPPPTKTEDNTNTNSTNQNSPTSSNSSSFSAIRNESDGSWEVYLAPRSILVIKEDARYKWKHGIEGKMEDILQNGEVIPRGRRVSLTFRKYTGSTSSEASNSNEN